jgi:hypothetical protein
MIHLSAEIFDKYVGLFYRKDQREISLRHVRELKERIKLDANTSQINVIPFPNLFALSNSHFERSGSWFARLGT